MSARCSVVPLSSLLVLVLGACASSGHHAVPARVPVAPAIATAAPESERPVPAARPPAGAPAAPVEDAGVLPCELTREPVEPYCTAEPCVLQRAERLSCAGALAFAARGAQHAAVVLLGPETWFVDLDPGSVRPLRRLPVQEQLVWGHLVAGAEGGYRLVATSLNRRAVVSLAIPASGAADASGELELVDGALPIVVLGAATTADGRALAWVGHRHDAAPLRRVEQAADGGWRSTEVFPRAWGHAFVAAQDPGVYGVLFLDARTAAQPPALFLQVGDGPARALAPYRARGATQLALTPDGGAAWVLDDADGVARLSALDARARADGEVHMPGAVMGPQACAAPEGTRPEAPSYRCTVRGEQRSAPALVPAADGALWALQVVRRLQVEQAVQRHFMPVDPTSRMTRVPPPHVEEERRVVADRSSGELVVYRVARRGKGLAVEERARLPVPELTGLTSAPPIAYARDGALHVLVQSPAGPAGVLRHLVLDAARLAP